MNPTEMMFKDRVSTLSDDACRDQLVLMLVESTIVDRKLDQAERERDEAIQLLIRYHNAEPGDMMSFGLAGDVENFLKKAGRL